MSKPENERAGEKEKSSLPGDIEKLTGVIPTLFYDLIARVIPGTAFLILLVGPALTLAPPLLSSYGDGTKLFLLLGAGYGAGIVLTGVAIFLDGLWLIIAELLLVCGIDSHRWLRPPQEASDVADFTAKESKSAGDRLAKMYAEITLCENLLCGFLIVIVADWFGSVHSNIYNLPPLWKVFICILLAFALVCRIVVYSVIVASYEKIYPNPDRNLDRWKQSGAPKRWVESCSGRWGDTEWVCLLNSLKASDFWPIEPEKLGIVLEEFKKDYFKQKHGVVPAISAAPVPRVPSSAPASNPA